ncbi:unnamed protein product, partial [Prorocentrum cordatum]
RAAGIYVRAKAALAKAESAPAHPWFRWAREAFQSGASKAREFSKVRAAHEIFSAGAHAAPFLLASDALGDATARPTVLLRTTCAEIAGLLGDASLSALLEVAKCCEVISSGRLRQEARALDFPMRLGWMLVDLRRQPRRLPAFASPSHICVAHRGMLAGCNHAGGTLFLLTPRAVKRIDGISPQVTPRALVDHVSVLIVSSSKLDNPQLGRAVESFTADAFDLGLWVQVKKIGLETGFGVGRRFMAT